MGAAELSCAQAREESRAAEIKQIVFFISASRKGRDPAAFGAVWNSKVGLENHSDDNTLTQLLNAYALDQSDRMISDKLSLTDEETCGYSVLLKRTVELVVET